ncbi:MAG: PTS sugar transporter subunit IIA [Treponema sp.]|jgi:PTS system nitrogen regulatory IIA component|nr:PTS sugar transporter subunit IIA [Treponema sp.]
MDTQAHTQGIIELLRRGGAHQGIQGAAPAEVLKNFIAKVPLPAGLEQARLVSAVLERELLMPTGIGRGIALPHPKNPLTTDTQEQLVAVAFLSQPVDWRALDGEPVHTAILIISASIKLHLNTLSWINFLCQQPHFQSLLKNQAPLEALIKAVQGFMA